MFPKRVEYLYSTISLSGTQLYICDLPIIFACESLKIKVKKIISLFFFSCLYKPTFFSISKSQTKIPSSLRMKPFSIFAIVILLLQVFLGRSALNNSPANIDEQSELVAMDKKHYHHNKKINCGYACSRRCRKSSRKNVCHRACKSCCMRCQCVPPGTYGNKQACPCYASLRTHGNKPKCP